MHAELGVKLELGIHVVGAAEVIVIDYLQSSDELDIVAADGFQEIPLAAEIDIGNLLAHIGQWGFGRVSGIGKPLDEHLAIDVVIGNYERIGPGLQPFIDIAIDYDIARNIVQAHPFRRTLDKGLCKQTVQQGHTLLYAPLHPGGSLSGVSGNSHDDIGIDKGQYTEEEQDQRGPIGLFQLFDKFHHS